ncbi:MAG: DUF115 domain-containing protein, partial [Treponema sp.]|nr:DUF115 domain-containing protein [Treponema sp.]
TEHDREKFEMAAQAIQESIDIITGDYSVQAHFGMRWFSNIIRNAKNPSLCENQAKLPVQVKRAAIAAAGPSLDSQMESIAKMKYEGVYIISTDTASGALVQSGIEPDVIVSIDCQHISYYHFTGSLLREKLRSVPLVLDIASPPLLSGLCAFPVFFASGHPFARYICAQWRSLPQLDTSGGNVTYTCLSLAERLGADHITIFGADFSYIGSRTYARGAYINPYFSARQNRLSALEAQMSSFLYRSPFLAQEGEKKIYRETSSLRHYRRKLEEKASMMQAHVECAKGFGPTVIIENKNCGAGKKEYEDGNIKMNLSGIEFLAQYRDGIASLPKAGGTDDYFNLLNAKEKLIFTTLLPFAAAIRKRNPRLKSADVIEETKKLCVMKIDAVL